MPNNEIMYNWRISVGLKTDVKKQASAYCPESFMRRVGRSFAPVIKMQTAGGRAPCSFPPRFSRRSREEKRGGNRRKHGRTTD